MRRSNGSYISTISLITATLAWENTAVLSTIISLFLTKGELPVYDLLLKVGAVVIALLMAAIILARQFGVGLGVQAAREHHYTELIGNLSIVSWLLIILTLFELIILALLFLSHRSTESA